MKNTFAWQRYQSRRVYSYVRMSSTV